MLGGLSMQERLTSTNVLWLRLVHFLSMGHIVNRGEHLNSADCETAAEASAAAVAAAAAAAAADTGAGTGREVRAVRGGDKVGSGEVATGGGGGGAAAEACAVGSNQIQPFFGYIPKTSPLIKTSVSLLKCFSVVS